MSCLLRGTVISRWACRYPKSPLVHLNNGILWGEDAVCWRERHAPAAHILLLLVTLILLLYGGDPRPKHVYCTHKLCEIWANKRSSPRDQRHGMVSDRRETMCSSWENCSLVLENVEMIVWEINGMNWSFMKLLCWSFSSPINEEYVSFWQFY